MYHRGGVSFGDEQSKGWSRSSALIDARYPFFRPTNTRERFVNPLAVPFAALELALIERDRRRPHVLHVTHSPLEAMGGTEKHVAALLESLAADFDFSVLYPVDSGFALHAYWEVDGRRVEPEFLLPGAALQVTRMDDPVTAFAIETALGPVRFRRGARAQPDRLLARAVRRARRIRRCRWCAPCTTCSSRARTSRCST